VGTLSKIPGFTRISRHAVSISSCNTSKSLIGAECTKAFRCPPQRKIQRIKVRRSCRPVDWAPASYPLFTRSLVQLLSYSTEKIIWYLIMHESHACSWWTGTCSKSTGKSFTKIRWYTALVSLLGKTTGPKCWSPDVPTQTLMENRCWCLDAAVVWGFSSTHTWGLWKVTIPSLENPPHQ
jgi:hypothetical protein